MPRRKTHEEYVSELREKGIQVEVLEPYIGSQAKIKHLWKKCGHVTEAIPAKVLYGIGCGLCHIRNLVSTGANACEKQRLKAAKELEGRVVEVHGNAVRRDLKTPYITSNTKISWLCEKGHQWEARPSDIKRGQGCPTCGAEKSAKAVAKSSARKSKLAVIRAYSQLDGISIEHLPTKDNPRGFPTSIMSREKWKCMKCYHVWVTSITSITNSGTGCPRCANGNTKGETHTRELLKEYGVEFQPQKKFPDLIRVNHLSYDFYIPSMNILIECQGQQHYEPNTFFHAEKAEECFADQQERDHLKREYARQNGYLLLEISYKDYRKDRITEILQEAGILPNKIVV